MDSGGTQQPVTLVGSAFRGERAEPAPSALEQEAPQSGAGMLTVAILVAGLIAVYFPAMRQAWNIWLTNANFAHGILVVPICCFLVWLQKKEISKAAVSPTPWGLALLGFGLSVAVVSYLLRIPYVAIWSMIPAIIGAILITRGVETWRIVRFPVAYLAFACPLPGGLLTVLTGWVQYASTTGAAFVMSIFGYPLVQRGNYIMLPQATLEIADVCSGFRKLLALIAFATLYGSLFRVSMGTRVLLILAAVPVAVLCNVLRISELISVTFAFGLRGLNIAHTPSDWLAVGIALLMLMGVGKWLGCKTLKDSPSPAP